MRHMTQTQCTMDVISSSTVDTRLSARHMYTILSFLQPKHSCVTAHCSKNDEYYVFLIACIAQLCDFVIGSLLTVENLLAGAW